VVAKGQRTPGVGGDEAEATHREEADVEEELLALRRRCHGLLWCAERACEERRCAAGQQGRERAPLTGRSFAGTTPPSRALVLGRASGLVLQIRPARAPHVQPCPELYSLSGAPSPAPRWFPRLSPLPSLARHDVRARLDSASLSSILAAYPGAVRAGESGPLTSASTTSSGSAGSASWDRIQLCDHADVLFATTASTGRTQELSASSPPSYPSDLAHELLRRPVSLAAGHVRQIAPTLLIYVAVGDSGCTLLARGDSRAEPCAAAPVERRGGGRSPRIGTERRAREGEARVAAQQGCAGCWCLHTELVYTVVLSGRR